MLKSIPKRVPPRDWEGHGLQPFHTDCSEWTALAAEVRGIACARTAHPAAKTDDVCGAYGTTQEVAEKLALDPVLKGRGFQPRRKYRKINAALVAN